VGNHADVRTIDEAEVERLMVDGAQVVEVLPHDEYELEHLPGAVSIPLKEIDASVRDRLDPARPVIVYCYDYQ
jgi:rhodanese-related sulfurtransferase